MSEIQVKDLEGICKRVLGRDVKLSPSLLRLLVDPEYVLDKRGSRGAPNPREVKRIISLRKKDVKALRARLSGRKLKIEKARERLMTEVGKYINE
jgi:hypothetical protein